jgi:small-conductance mechanosensitive channel
MPTIALREHCATDERGTYVKLRSLLLLPAGETEKHSPEQLPSGPPGSDPPGAEWDVLAELDRLRGANAGLSAEVKRRSQIGDDYARAASDLRLRVEELERETAIAHSNAQFLQRRLTQAEERVGELEELTESLRAQRERLETYCEQQRARAERSESAAAAMRGAGGDALERLRSSLDEHAGERYLGPETGDQVRRFFTDETLASDQKRELRQVIMRSLEPKRE